MLSILVNAKRSRVSGYDRRNVAERRGVYTGNDRRQGRDRNDHDACQNRILKCGDTAVILLECIKKMSHYLAPLCSINMRLSVACALGVADNTGVAETINTYNQLLLTL
jgi:hypothetical protein